MVKITKRKVPEDSAWGNKPKYRYSVNGWDFPTKEMAENFKKRFKRGSK